MGHILFFFGKDLGGYWGAMTFMDCADTKGGRYFFFEGWVGRKARGDD